MVLGESIRASNSKYSLVALVGSGVSSRGVELLTRAGLFFVFFFFFFFFFFHFFFFFLFSFPLFLSSFPFFLSFFFFL